MSNREDRQRVVAAAAAPPTLKPLSPWVKVIAGMCGGVAEACALQPLDVTKTRLQLDHSGRYRGMFHCGSTIFKEEGPKALYKGLSPFVMHLVLKYALRFGSFGWFKSVLGGGKGKGENEAGINFTAGLMAGVLEAIVIVTPFEVVKTRLQKQEGLTNLKYKGPVHTVRTMIAEEGLTSLWKGVAPTMIRQGSNQAFNFMTFSMINSFVWGKNDGDGRKQELWKTFGTGLVSSTVGPLFNCPMDVIKTRMMAQVTVPGETPRYTGFVQAFQLIAREEGMAALWKGLIPRLARLAPGQAITWTVVTRITTMFEQRAQNDWEQAKAASASK